MTVFYFMSSVENGQPNLNWRPNSQPKSANMSSQKDCEWMAKIMRFQTEYHQRGTRGAVPLGSERPRRENSADLPAGWDSSRIASRFQGWQHQQDVDLHDMMTCYLLHQPYLPEEWNVPATADVAQRQLRTVLEKMNATRGYPQLTLGWAAVFFWLESLHFDMLTDNPHLVEDALEWSFASAPETPVWLRQLHMYQTS